MTKPDKWIVILLRVSAVVLLMAVPTIVLPFDWMNATHAFLGLGELPRVPIVEYLARSESCLYSILGVATLILSFDVERYRPLISFWATGHVLGGACLLIIDISAGMPWFWTIAEGPGLIAIGGAVFVLQRAANRSS